MANLTSVLTVRLIDAVAGPARAAANSIRGIGNAVDSTNARRLAIGGAVSTMVSDVGKQTQILKRNLHSMTTGLSMPAGFLTFFGARAVYDFEKTSNALQAVTDITDEQRKSIQSYAKELNELFPATNSEIMKGAYELGRAGFKYDQIMGSMKGMLNLALAGDIAIKESSDIATNILTAMRLPMKTVEQASDSLTRVNDALAYSASNSNTDVRMMGETFKYVGPMAAAAGLSIEQVAAASMVMARNGIRASEAGVAMRSALVRMVRPTKPMLQALGRLNVDIDKFVKGGRQISAQDVVSSLAIDGIDASSFSKQIEQVLNDPSLNTSLSKLSAKLAEIIGGDGTAVDKSKLAETITDVLTAAGSEVDFFGFIRALREKGADLGDIARIFDARQGSRLITLLAGDLDKALSDVEKNAKGATDRMAKTMMKGIVGDWAEFEASVENLFVSIAESGVLKTASEAFKLAADGLKSLAQSNPKLLEFGTYALMIAGVLGPIALVGGGVISFFTSLLAMLLLVTKIGRGALGVAGAAMGISGVAGATGAGAAAAGAAAGAGAASKGSSLLGKAAKGAGIIGTAWTIKEVLDAVDPEGNLWGLTSGIDAWIESKTGINPSKVGGSQRVGPEATAEEGRTHDISEWQARQAEIDARLAQIEKNTHPAMRDMPNIERDNLQTERSMLDQQINAAIPQAQPAEAAAAAKQTMDGYNAALSTELSAAEQQIDAFMARIKQKMATTLSPVISPRLDTSSISGLHADIGVE
ncbi:phage tail tape measure protein [Brucella anthropi]|uniref:Phage tail tape measure protein n=1 Tax=Brucella haematophila TaxID=419474 RepID=A0ABX1DI40_9HYPH|nr:MULTISPECIES: phage tail tape measure protein [Brucella]KAB2776541.1 phage tail tape measure protein [Brucella anthropi]NKC02416.1 phage tail tape measure protein [Brucella haematophila]TMV03126.1 phage tail tape measure protein [Brucella haematophila]